MRRRKGISSIYGFIMIFLLSMASLQTWSSAVGSITTLESASDQGHQLQQMQFIEHLSLTEFAGNLTILNNGEIPSTALFLRLVGANSSRTVSLNTPLAIGSAFTSVIPSGYAVEVVTSLGNVFSLYPSSDPPGSVWSGAVLSGGKSNAQVFRSPYYSPSFFVSDGSTVYAFSSFGRTIWSFDSGSGYITDVLPLSNGDVYVSAGYGSTSNDGELFELNSGGSVIQTYPIRVFQTPAGATGESQMPVTKGLDSGYAYYDGWFYSASGPSAALTSDAFPLAGSEASDYYFYQVRPASYQDGLCQPPGTEFGLDSYSPGPYFADGIKLNWQHFVYLGTCNNFPSQLVGSAVGGGVVAALLASPPYAASSVEDYPGQNPYLVVVSTSGDTLYQGQIPQEGYSDIATNGTQVYMTLPQPGLIQVYSLTKGSFTSYDLGIHASHLIFEDGYLFAVSSGVVKVFDSSMGLKKTIDLAPLSLASSSDTFLQEPALQVPSFTIINSTAYAVLLENATGFTTLVEGRYA